MNDRWCLINWPFFDILNYETDQTEERIDPMKNATLIKAGAAFCILLLVAVGIYIIAGGARYDHSGYFQTSGDDEYLETLLSAANSKDWNVFFEATQAEGAVLSISAEKQRFIQGLADPDSGDYSMGEVHLTLVLKDLRN